MTDKSVVKITLTPEQQVLIERTTGKQVRVVELKPEALEGRAAPRLAAN
jgi:hypothetical protein